MAYGKPPHWWVSVIYVAHARSDVWTQRFRRGFCIQMLLASWCKKSGETLGVTADLDIRQLMAGIVCPRTHRRPVAPAPPPSYPSVLSLRQSVTLDMTSKWVCYPYALQTLERIQHKTERVNLNKLPQITALDAVHEISNPEGAYDPDCRGY